MNSAELLLVLRALHTGAEVRKQVHSGTRDTQPRLSAVADTHDPSTLTHTHTHPSPRHIRLFPDKAWHTGTITSVDDLSDEFPWTVTYHDGDVENYSQDELLLVLAENIHHAACDLALLHATPPVLELLRSITHGGASDVDASGLDETEKILVPRVPKQVLRRSVTHLC